MPGEVLAEQLAGAAHVPDDPDARIERTRGERR
jgi:hypothetical protein